MVTRRRRRDNGPRHTGNRRGIRRRRRLRNTRFPAARYHLTVGRSFTGRNASASP